MSEQWRHQTALEAYPFRVGAARRSSLGELSSGDFVDFHAVCRGRVWLSSIEIGADGFSGAFVSSLGESLSFSVDGFGGGAAPLESSFGGTRGVVVFGTDDLFPSMPAGLHSFQDLAVEVLPCLVCPPPPGISSIVAGGSRVYGRVSLSGTAGISMEASVSGGNTLARVHADGDFVSSDCLPGTPVLSINGVSPGDAGGIGLHPSSFPVPAGESESRQVLRVNPVANGIRVSLVDPDV